MTKVISPNDIIPSSYNSGWGENKSTILADPARFMDSSGWDGKADFTISLNDTSITDEGLSDYMAFVADPVIFEKENLIRLGLEADTEGPFKSAKDADTHGVTRQEIITYRKRDGYLVRETAIRVFDNTDYTDHTATIVIAKIGE